MYNSDIKARARYQLGGRIFHDNWLYALAACLIVTASIGSIQWTVRKLAIPVILVSGPLYYSLSYMFLKQSRDNLKMSFADILIGFDDFGDTFLIGLLTTLFTALWSCLFLIPGIIKAYSYSAAYYIKADNPNLTAFECISASQRLMEGHKMDLFRLDLSFIGWAFVCVCTCGIGFLWLIPYMHAARAHFYRSLISV